MREFLHVDDMAAATVHVMNLDPANWQAHTRPMLSHINVSTGIDCSIRELSETIAEVTDFTVHLTFDTSKPDGTPQKTAGCIQTQIPGLDPKNYFQGTGQWDDPA
jgi:GDP-L-fucose synthase